MNTDEKPLRIGISACFFHADPLRAIFKGKTLQYLEQSMAHWLMREGNLVYLIPLPEVGAKVTLDALADSFDALVLEGGSDVCPRTYGEEPLKPEWNGDAIRDAYEIELFRIFLKQKKPILGVCRGAQLMNVALGGSLYQDVELQVPGALNHRNWEIYDQNFHELEIKAGSGLAALGGPLFSRVNTIHHQAIKKLGNDLQVEAVSPRDGIIEAIRYTGESYALAVQWHPEFHDRQNSNLFDDQKILKQFMHAAVVARQQRGSEKK